MKYPRTLHLPWSPGWTNEDKRAKTVDSLINKKLVVTEKIDGSNTCMTRDACFSRSHAGPPTHASFDGFKSLHATVRHAIPEGWEVFGEWCYALHSIPYEYLPSYFLAIGIRYNNQWLSWDSVLEFCRTAHLATVPELYRGFFQNEKDIKTYTTQLAMRPSNFGDIREGVVIRLIDDFPDEKFSESVMKWVREDHVQTDEHWKNQKIVKNRLA